MEVVAIVISYARWVVASCVGVVAVLITRLLLGYPSFDLVPTSIFEFWVIVNLPLHLLVTASGLPESVGGIIFYCLIFLQWMGFSLLGWFAVSRIKAFLTR